MHSSPPCLQACSMWICSIVLSDSQSAPRAKEPEVEAWGRKKKNPRNPRVVWLLPARGSKLRQSCGVGSLPVFYSFEFQKSSKKNKRTLFCAWIPNPGPSLLWYLFGHLSLVSQKLTVPGSSLLFSFSSAVRAPGSTFCCLVSKWPLPFAGFLPSHFDPCISVVSFPVFAGTCKGWLAAFPWALSTRTVLINCTPQAPGVPILAVDHQTPYF